VADERPLLDGINLVVRDMDAMLEFYQQLGLDVAPAISPWDRHHRTLSTPEGLDFDLDSEEFARQWNHGWPRGATGPVIGFRLPSREAVDATYERLVGAGAVGEQSPYDAFWGARYAVVADPEGNAVGLMSPREPARQAEPPDPDA
jgi:uncharacterized glyoxalase superfamily protein PhnB